MHYGQGKPGGDAETEDTVDEGSHNLQMDKGDIELGEGKKTLLRQPIAGKVHGMLKSSALL